MDYEAIRSVVDSYRKSGIQSEAEVSTKFIYPLFKALGYPDELMAQEFPVFGYGGRESLGAKAADFIYFKSIDFSSHRSNTQDNKKWVCDNSLLIVEAKKLRKMPEDMGQAQFYTMWTKSVAYVVTDGVWFRAFFYNSLCSDFVIIDTSIDDLPNTHELKCIEYECLLNLKKSSFIATENLYANIYFDDEQSTIITKDEDLNIPEETISYFRGCLGKNSIGLSNVQVLTRFLNTTDCYLNNDIRYDIPTYMIDFPRHCYDAHIYINNNVFPIVSGQITEFYCAEESRYHFKSDYIEVVIQLVSDRVVAYAIDYHVLDKTVAERIYNFKFVKRILDSQNISIRIENDSSMMISLPNDTTKGMWLGKKHVTSLYNFWYEEMKKLEAIEEYYNIKFNLIHVSGKDEISQLYDAIDFVYDGMNLQENCVVSIPAKNITEDIEIEYPILFEENKQILLESLVIHGIVFKPYRSVLLPCTIKKKKQGIHRIPACCEYKLLE